MNRVYLQSSNIISPLGFTTTEVFENAAAGKSGVTKVHDNRLSQAPFFGAVLDWDSFYHSFPALSGMPRMEALFIASIQSALPPDFDRDKSLLILSTTKGSIDQLREHDHVPLQAFPYETAKSVASFLGLKRQPILVSNACISGVMAINMAARLIAAGKEKNVIVSGGDLVTDFVVAGFNSLMAIGGSLCKPFDANRDGINLGEAAATVVLSAAMSDVEVLAGYTSNDANHISGPSRTGEGLLNAVQKTLDANKKTAVEVDYISAHGTATLFNDDMESKAFQQAGLANTPLNSLKGFFGHTLGAAGIVESIMAVESMKRNYLLKNMGCNEPGTAETLNILLHNQEIDLSLVLKTASGFGGCNAAVLFQKHG